MENWRDIQGYEGSYQASDLGRIKSLTRAIKYSSGWVQSLKGRIMRPRKNGNGYLTVNLSKLVDNKHTYKTQRVHRLVAQTFISNPESKYAVNHKNGIKIDNKTKNLEWVTKSENEKHAHRTGLKDHLKGEKHISTKFNDAQIYIIKWLLYLERFSINEIADIFKMSGRHIYSIKNNKCRGYVKYP